MSEQQAESVSEKITLDSGDETVVQDQITPEANDDSVSASDTGTETGTPEVKEPHEDGFQKRINKVTAQKYAEKQRADQLQAQLDKVNNQGQPQSTPNAIQPPKMEDFDYDEERFNNARIDYQVQKAIAAQSVISQKASDAQVRSKQQSEFNDRVVGYGKDDFDVVANQVPVLPPGVADALMQSELGPEMIYHLGSHLDVADKISQMTPGSAMMELGKISANLKATPKIVPSSALDPIEPLQSGGSLSKERGPKGARFE